MTDSAPQVFHGVTPEGFARLANKAQSAGIPINGNSGSASKFGMEVAWSYSPESQELTIHCLRSPFFLSMADVQARIRSLVQQTAEA